MLCAVAAVVVAPYLCVEALSTTHMKRDRWCTIYAQYFLSIDISNVSRGMDRDYWHICHSLTHQRTFWFFLFASLELIRSLHSFGFGKVDKQEPQKSHIHMNYEFLAEIIFFCIELDFSHFIHRFFSTYFSFFIQWFFSSLAVMRYFFSFIFQNGKMCIFFFIESASSLHTPADATPHIHTDTWVCKLFSFGINLFFSSVNGLSLSHTLLLRRFLLFKNFIIIYLSKIHQHIHIHIGNIDGDCWPNKRRRKKYFAVVLFLVWAPLSRESIFCTPSQKLTKKSPFCLVTHRNRFLSRFVFSNTDTQPNRDTRFLSRFDFLSTHRAKLRRKCQKTGVDEGATTKIKLS